jgi:Glycogen recognition site of AMP-activated protein kinase
MRDEREWSPEAHRFFDGAGPPPLDAEERNRAARFADVLEHWADELPTVDERLDARVLAAVRARARRSRRHWWRWAVEPRPIAMRPALAAAALVALVATSSLITAKLRQPAVQATGGPAAGSGTVLVRFELVAPGAERVALAGSFNEWSDSSIVFTESAAPGVWSATVALPPGRYQYLFVVDGTRWIPDPLAHAQVEDEFGQRNSLLVVGPRGVVRS